MLVKVVNAPINLYYDVTPLGRILNKFSKDLSNIESELMWSLGFLLACFYQALGVLVIAVIVVKWILLGIPLVFLAAIYLYRNSIAAFREVTRLESLTKSPILSFFSETINGASTIRSFGKQGDFMRENHRQLNKNILAN